MKYNIFGAHKNYSGGELQTSTVHAKKFGTEDGWDLK